MIEVLVALAAAGLLVLGASRASGSAVPGAVAVQGARSDPFAFAERITGVPAYLMTAIAHVESSMRPRAVRVEPNGKRSIGLTQVLCPSPLNIEGWCGDAPCVGGCDALYDPQTNVVFGARVMEWNLRTYGYPRGVAVYNRWLSRLDPPRGPFGNQGYVDKVRRHLTDAQHAELLDRFGNGSAG